MKGIYRFIWKQKKPFKVNLLKNIIRNFSDALTLQYQAIFMSALGADPIEIGYVNSIGGVAGAVLSIPIGWLTTKWGIRNIFLTGLPLLILSSAIFAIAQSWEITLVALVISMIAVRLSMTGCPLVCGNTLNNEERVTGMQLCDTISAMPRLVAPIVAAYIITAYGGLNVEGIRPLYWIRSLGLIIALLLIYKYFNNPSHMSIETAQSTLLGDLRRIFKEGVKVKHWILYLMFSTFPMYIGNTFTPLYLAEVQGTNEVILGWMFTASWLAVIVLALPIGRFADRFGRKKMILLMTPLYCASLFLIVYAWDVKILLLSGFLSGFFTLMAVTQGAITAELVPRELLGSWFGVLGLFRGVIGIISPIVGGVIWEIASPDYIFYFLIATQLVKLVILGTIPLKVQRKTE